MDQPQRIGPAPAEDADAPLVEQVETEFQVSLIETMDDERAADVLEEMEPDEAADLLAELLARRFGASGLQVEYRPFASADDLPTDGQILANNTDAGPRPSPSGQQLDWAVNVRSASAPMALVRLSQ